MTAVAAIAGAGGVPIIAHPAGRAGLLPTRLVQRMLAAGLAGFELGHRENVEPALTTLRELVAREDLKAPDIAFWERHAVARRG